LPRVKESVDIRAPIDRVFATITDPRRSGDWNPNVVGIEGLSEGAVRQGTSWTQYVLIAGRRARLTCRISAYRAPFAGVLDISGDQNAVVSTRCEATGGMTRVTQTLDFKPPGGRLGALAGGTLTPVLHREVKRALERARAAIEQEALESHGSRPS
jgi:uncharacterized protein YndB with AHSA1/START domain